MVGNKKNHLFLILLFFISFKLLSSNLKILIEKGDFSNIEKVFYDESWKKIVHFFSDSLRIVVFEAKDRIVYFKYLEQHGTFGIVKFKVKDGKYGDVEIFGDLGKFYYIKNILCSRLKKYIIKGNDFHYILKKGLLCYPTPSKNPVFIYGKGEFFIEPRVDVEKQHLIFLVGKNFYKIKTNSIAFWNREIELRGNFTKVRKYWKKLREPLKLLSISSGKEFFKKHKIYFPISKKHKTALMLIKGRKIGIYNEKMSGEISYFIPEEKRLLVDYNIKKGFLFSEEKNTHILSPIKKIRFIITNVNKEKIVLKEELYLKPSTKFLSLHFSNNIRIRKVSWDKGDLFFFSAGDFIFFFNTENFSLLSIEYEIPAKMYIKSPDLYLMKDKKFYLFPDEESFYFFEVIHTGEKDSYKSFFSKRAEISIVRGILNELSFNFFKVKIVSPLTSAELKKIKTIFKNVHQYISGIKFLKLNIYRFEIILKRASYLSFEGGERILFISYSDFYELNKKEFEYRVVKEILKLIFLNSFVFDSYKEDFIAEGFSEYFALNYLRETNYRLYKSRINKIVKEVFKRWKAGPIIFGRRIGNWEKSYKNYKTIVSGKMFILLTLGDKIFGINSGTKLAMNLFKNHFRKVLSVEKFLEEARTISKEYEEFIISWLYNYKKPHLKVERIDGNYKISNMSDIPLLVVIEEKRDTVLFPGKEIFIYSESHKIRKNVREILYYSLL